MCLFRDFQLLILTLALILVSLERANTCGCVAHKNAMNFLPLEKKVCSSVGTGEGGGVSCLKRFIEASPHPPPLPFLFAPLTSLLVV